MSTANSPFQVLVTSGNQGVLAAGSRPTSLAVGQVGFFNIHTGLSVDGTVPGDCRDIFIAVGVNKTGAGGGATLEDINKSAGQMLQTQRTKAITLKGTVSEQVKVYELTGFIAKPNHDYDLKIEFRNDQIYGLYGYNQFTKTFSYKTACVTPSADCSDCPQGDCNELTMGIADNINADLDQLVTAAMFGNSIAATIATGAGATASLTVTIGGFAYTVPVVNADTASAVAAKIIAVVNTTANTPYKGTNAGAVMTFYGISTASGATGTFVLTNANGTGVTANTISNTTTIVTDANLATFKVNYPGVCLGVRITGNILPRPAYAGNIPLKYFRSGLEFIVTPVAGFSCNGTLTNTQTLIYPEGNGYDMQELEYVAGGWNGKPGPYRTSTLTGTQKIGFEYYAVAATNYNQIDLTYDNISTGGWIEYENGAETIIAVPCADTTTLQAIIAVTDVIFTQFSTLTALAAATDCSNGTTNTLTVANNGLKSTAI